MFIDVMLIPLSRFILSEDSIRPFNVVHMFDKGTRPCDMYLTRMRLDVEAWTVGEVR